MHHAMLHPSRSPSSSVTVGHPPWSAIYGGRDMSHDATQELLTMPVVPPPPHRQFVAGTTQTPIYQCFDHAFKGLTPACASPPFGSCLDRTGPTRCPLLPRASTSRKPLQSCAGEPHVSIAESTRLCVKTTRAMHLPRQTG